VRCHRRRIRRESAHIGATQTDALKIRATSGSKSSRGSIATRLAMSSKPEIPQTKVRDESLANLRQEFEPLKEILKESSYADLIAWSEYEELESGKPKPIDVRDIISYLITFDTAAYNSTSQPLIAYKDKQGRDGEV
jgi:hypothetical protein